MFLGMNGDFLFGNYIHVDILSPCPAGRNLAQRAGVSILSTKLSKNHYPLEDQLLLPPDSCTDGKVVGVLYSVHIALDRSDLA